MKKSFSPSEAISIGWEVFKKNTWLFILLGLILFAVSSIGGIFDRKDIHTGLILLTNVAWITLSILVNVGIIKISLQVLDGKKAEVSNLFDYSNYGFKYFFVQMITLLIVLLGFVTPIVSGVIWAIKVGWKKVKKNGWYFFALLVAPWLVWSLQFLFAPYFVIDKDEKVIESFKKSSLLTEHAKFDLFAFSLLQVLITIMGIMCFYIGIIVALPVLLIAKAYVYRKLLEQTKFVTEKKIEDKKIFADI